MTKLNLSLGVFLMGAALVAVNTTGCKSSGGGSGTAGASGSQGAAGTGGATAGSTGAGGSGGVATNSCTMMNDATVTLGTPCKCVPGAFPRNGACSCQMDTPDVCPAVGCVNKMLDVANCGTCGMACGATSTCNNGTCGAAPTMVSAAITGCTNMTMVASDAVYFADEAHGTINKVGTATPLAMGEMGATFLAQNGTNLFWYDKGTHKIRKMAAAGGAVSDVYTDTAMGADGGMMPDVAGFLVSPDGMTIYISLGNNVYKQPVAGGTPTIVAEEVHAGLPAALALNGTTNIVYPSTFNGDVDAPLLAGAPGGGPAICGMPSAADPDQADMTSCPRLGRSQGELFPNFIAVIGGHAYWIDGPNVKGEMIGPMGMSFDSIAAAQTSHITAAVATTDTIYFADSEPADPSMPNAAGGFIEKTPLTPMSTPILLARGQKQPMAIAVDATKVYWANSDCSIQSVAK